MKSNSVRSHYNNDVETRAGNAYEFDRWHKDPVSQAGYDMTKIGIKRSLKGLDSKNCFELGPGAGTWTKVLCAEFPSIHIDAFDISSHMLKMAKENIENCDVSFIEGDFDSYDGDEGVYDLFFSSRVFEYLPNQKKALGIIAKILSPGGEGIISTKFPRGDISSDLHKGRIHPKVFKKLLKNTELDVVSICPLTVTVPFFKSSKLNKLAFFLLAQIPFSFVHSLFCESYIIRFKKL
ncbi:class I SAM-dependent methyltransferase [Candidatus Wolfebacteria bacterium]|nr:class I SAM-dependent methyltransferase [Candidatus Wolfebacteria bacterium]